MQNQYVYTCRFLNDGHRFNFLMKLGGATGMGLGQGLNWDGDEEDREGYFGQKNLKMDGKLMVSDFGGLCLIKFIWGVFSNTAISAGG